MAIKDPQDSKEQKSPDAINMEDVVSLCKRRGIIYPGSEIYGGLGSTWDYGPLGVELKRNVKEAWWKSIVQERDDVVGLDAAILMHPQTWVASGHVEGFTDPMVECRGCNRRWRVDNLNEGSCPDCDGEVTEPRMFNLMFKTHAGPVEDEGAEVYLRPETAQGIFVNFGNVLNTSRKKLPFGIAQVGKAFRNEITPGNFTFRTREFEQMELEFFVNPGTDERWHQEWVSERFKWYVKFGIREQNLRIRVHGNDELAHYASACSDIEYRFPWGWSELEGIANRQDFDLKQHAQHSGKDLSYFDQEKNEHFVPYVIEPSGGVDRATLAFLIDSYRNEMARTGDGKEEQRVVLRLNKNMAPVKVAILPLSRNEQLVPIGREIYEMVRQHWVVQYDESQSIGRRYRRQDEIGTPYCVTIDFDSLDDRAVTIRDRDTMEQVRVPIAEVVSSLDARI